jgi:hypothetical protein
MRWLALFLGVLLMFLAIAAFLLVNALLVKQSGDDVIDAITTSAVPRAIPAAARLAHAGAVSAR